MNKEKIDKIYKENLHFPYCSATSFYLLSNIETPTKFWSNCYEQAKKLKNDLKKCNIETKFLEDIKIKRHRSLVYMNKDLVIYFWPYLILPNPIIFENITNLEIDSFPYLVNKNSTVTVNKNSNILNVSKNWPNSNRIDSFYFDLNLATNYERIYEEYLEKILHPEQKNLSIRVIDFENNNLLHYVFDFINHKFYVIFNTTRHDKWSKEFNLVLSRIWKIINSSPSEIEDYIYWWFLNRQKLISN